jgi:hypothetical protein
LWIKFLTSAIDSKNATAIKTQSITIIALHLLSDIALFSAGAGDALLLPLSGG